MQRARATARPRGLGETDNQPDVEDAADAAAEHARTDPVRAVVLTSVNVIPNFGIQLKQTFQSVKNTRRQNELFLRFG